MTAKDRLRYQMRSRVYSQAAELPDGLDADLEVIETLEKDGVTVTMIVRRGSPGGRALPADAPEPPPAGHLEPVQQYLPCCGLLDIEAAVLAVLLAGGNARLVLSQLVSPVALRLGRTIKEGTLKSLLGRLCDRRVGVLDNVRAGSRPGYAVTERYRQLLIWCQQRGAANDLAGAA